MRHTLIAIAVYGTIILQGCTAQSSEPHVQVYQQFVRAVASGDVDAALGLLSSDSRRRIEDARSMGGAGPDKNDQDWLLLQPGWQFELDIPSSARAEFDERVPDRATVTGPLEGAVRSIPMVLEEGEWRIDLFGATRTTKERPNAD